MQGIQGIQGIPGPTAAASAGGTPPPVISANTSGQGFYGGDTDLTTTAAGKVLAYGQADGEYQCNSGPCQIDIGLYVDGQPVPGSDRVFEAMSGNLPFSAMLFGVAGTLPAGAHDVQVGFLLNNATPVTGITPTARTVAVALGTG